jgi:hypothetical protein
MVVKLNGAEGAGNLVCAKYAALRRFCEKHGLNGMVSPKASNQALIFKVSLSKPAVCRTAQNNITLRKRRCSWRLACGGRCVVRHAAHGWCQP